MLRILKAQPVDAVLKVPKNKIEPVEVSVSTEITEDEFNAVFSKDPEPQEVQSS